MLESLWDRLPEEAKRDIAKDIEKILIEKGVDPIKASKTTTAIITGSLTLAKSILRFKFHILLAQFSNMLWKVIFNRGLTLSTNAALQKLVGTLFGPVGWIISGILIIPVIFELINPRS